MLATKQFYSLLVIGCLLGWAWVLIHVFQVTDSGTSLQVCLLQKATNLPCASCGTTRGVSAFFSGNIVQAFLHNPLSLFISCCLLILPVFLLKDAVSKKKQLYRAYLNFNLNRTFWIIGLTIFILCWTWNLYKHYNQLAF
ncbi:DUF2752 domain-containing protein [Flavobacterium agricola]|uniref:DUF2752 domain-containing protein n=1 Tax=Flavobacterium agricola TaxID=2870839 RepID=A0ABY6M1T9_9FLAO|nr:DUF2752 domain-containing protein [Flavobacterium agricola]